MELLEKRPCILSKRRGSYLNSVIVYHHGGCQFYNVYLACVNWFCLFVMQIHFAMILVLIVEKCFITFNCDMMIWCNLTFATLFCLNITRCDRVRHEGWCKQRKYVLLFPTDHCLFSPSVIIKIVWVKVVIMFLYSLVTCVSRERIDNIPSRSVHLHWEYLGLTPNTSGTNHSVHIFTDTTPTSGLPNSSVLTNYTWPQPYSTAVENASYFSPGSCVSAITPSGMARQVRAKCYCSL